ncbi:MAG: ComF family protein [Polyangiaceae bacterium]|nr:ComF family protein [Polyangiaceae bacterium]
MANAVRRFKYGGRTDLAQPLGRLLVRAVEYTSLEADLVIPVPLHPRRLVTRGYNQAALLGAFVADLTRAPLRTNVLKRSRDTAHQAWLGRAQRLVNLQDAFEIKRPEAVAGRRVVLVDDVCTTGATLAACCNALMKAGAIEVTALVVAYTPNIPLSERESAGSEA